MVPEMDQTRSGLSMLCTVRVSDSLPIYFMDQPVFHCTGKFRVPRPVILSPGVTPARLTVSPPRPFPR